MESFFLAAGFLGGFGVSFKADNFSLTLVVICLSVLSIMMGSFFLSAADPLGLAFF